MTRVSSPPFLQPDPDLISGTDWEIRHDECWRPLDQKLDEWDYATTLFLRRKLVFDPVEVLEDCQLPDSTRLAYSVVWHATRTNMRGAVTRDADRENPLIVIELPGNELGGQLRLTSRLVLARPTQGPRLAPTRAGSILWQDQKSVFLEGEAPLFPVEVIDFAKAGYPDDASWYLDWSPEEPERATLGSLRLYINSEARTVRKAIDNPDADDVSRLITSVLQWDLLRQLVEGALNNRDFDTALDYPEGSLGRTMKTAMQLAFGNAPASSVRQRRQISLGKVEAKLQSVSHLFKR